MMALQLDLGVVRVRVGAIYIRIYIYVNVRTYVPRIHIYTCTLEPAHELCHFNYGMARRAPHGGSACEVKWSPKAHPSTSASGSSEPPEPPQHTGLYIQKECVHLLIRFFIRGNFFLVPYNEVCVSSKAVQN